MLKKELVSVTERIGNRDQPWQHGYITVKNSEKKELRRHFVCVEASIDVTPNKGVDFIGEWSVEEIINETLQADELPEEFADYSDLINRLIDRFLDEAYLLP